MAIHLAALLVGESIRSDTSKSGATLAHFDWPNTRTPKRELPIAIAHRARNTSRPVSIVGRVNPMGIQTRFAIPARFHLTPPLALAVERCGRILVNLQREQALHWVHCSGKASRRALGDK